ncbi:DNA primase [candidate division KSB1 bacterium]|nr:DNA primase [candidate division KSB1 bacterium]
MAQKIPEEKIAEIREATDIVDLISGYLTLKKRGKNYFGLCPFHQENTPSFSVDPTKQIYHCFGCHKGGNAISFLMEYEKMSFLEAVRYLAEKAGISIPQVRGSDSGSQEKEAIYYANKFAAEYYFKNLMSTAGKNAQSYLEKRGYGSEIIRKFGMGYALNEWDGLIKHAQRKSVTMDALHKAGLIIKKDNGRYYDRFRGRVMVPIISLTKKVVGFGGRIIIEDEKAPKYINTPETPIYQKSNILFGLYQTRDFIREKDQAIFVEGYTDLLSLYKYGIKNVVATSGTALTIQQAQLIKRYTSNIVLLYDSDSAGSAAAMRGADIFLSTGLEVKISTMPAGEDPDSYIRNHGAEKFTGIIDSALSLINFKIKILENQYDLSNMTNRARVIELLLESVSNVTDNIKKGLIVKQIAEYFGMEERLLLGQLKKVKRYDRKEMQGVKSTSFTNDRMKNRYDLAEEHILKIALEESYLLPTIYEHLKIIDIRNALIRDIIHKVYELYESEEKIDGRKILNIISDPEKVNLISYVLSEHKIENIEKVMNASIQLVKLRVIEEESNKIQLEIKELENKGQDVSQKRLRWNQLRQEREKIKSKKFVEEQKNT